MIGTPIPMSAWVTACDYRFNEVLRAAHILRGQFAETKPLPGHVNAAIAHGVEAVLSEGAAMVEVYHDATNGYTVCADGERIGRSTDLASAWLEAASEMAREDD